MRSCSFKLYLLPALLCLSAQLCLPALALAQPPASAPATQAPATQAQVAALQQAVQSAQAAADSARMAGDNAWMLVSVSYTHLGAIVNTASSLGQVAIPNAAEYIASKHGVIGLTRAAAADYGARGIRVNAVLPGIIKTPMITRLTQDARFKSMFDKAKERHPIGRFGEPAEIGEAVKWLLSGDASFMNGAAMAVDGGYLAV